MEDAFVAILNLLYSVKKHMFLGGKIENWITVIDLSNLSLWTIPLKVD